MNNRKLVFLLIGILLLFTVKVNAGGIVFDTLEEGEQNTYTLDNKDYEVEVLIIEDNSPETVTFKLNGELTEKLIEGDTAEFADGTVLTVLDLFNNEAGESESGDIVAFRLVSKVIKGSELEINKVKVTVKNLDGSILSEKEIYDYLHDELRGKEKLLGKLEHELVRLEEDFSNETDQSRKDIIQENIDIMEEELEDLRALVDNLKEEIDRKEVIDNLKPWDTVKLEVEVENKFRVNENVNIDNVTIKNTEESIGFGCKGSRNVAYETPDKEFTLKPEETAKIDLIIDISEEDEDENFKCEILVTGSDETGFLHQDTFEFNLRIGKSMNDEWSIPYIPANYKLDLYPRPYLGITEDKDLGVINEAGGLFAVVGENAPALDTLILVDILTKLQKGNWTEDYDGKFFKDFIDAELINKPGTIQDSGADLIIVGHPCENLLVEKLSNYKCKILEDGTKSIKGLNSGIGLIEAVRLGQGNPNTALIVSGNDQNDRRKAGKVLANFESYKDLFYRRSKVLVAGTLDNPTITHFVEKIDGLDASDWMTYFNEWGTALPIGLRAPLNSEMNKQFEFFQIDINHDLPENKTFDIYFNLPKASLGSVLPNDVKLYVYEESQDKWVELPTTVLDASSDIVKFKATTPHFSNFVVAQIPLVPDTSSSSGSSGGGGGGGGSSRRTKVSNTPVINNIPPRECALGYTFDEREQCVLLNKPVQEPKSEIQKKIKTEAKQSQSNLFTGFSVLGNYIKSKEGIIIILGSITSLLLLSYLYFNRWYIRFRLKLLYIQIKYLF